MNIDIRERLETLAAARQYGTIDPRRGLFAVEVELGLKDYLNRQMLTDSLSTSAVELAGDRASKLVMTIV